MVELPDDELPPRYALESPQERIERLIAAGRIDLAAVNQAIDLWRQRWQSPVTMPNGEAVLIELSDLYHALAVPRILRRPERIERAIHGVFELRTTDRPPRRIALSEWMKTLIHSTPP